MEFKQLMLTGDGMSHEQEEFKQLHLQIIATGNTASMYFLETANLLKRMRERELYREAGFETFNDYVEKACGIGKRQAYNFIAVIEKFDENFLQLNAQLGVTKLSLLASMTEGDRGEMLAEQGEKVNEMSVSALKEAIKAQEDKCKQLSLDLSELEEKNRELAEDNEALEQENKSFALENIELSKKQDATAEAKARELAAAKQAEFEKTLLGEKKKREEYEKKISDLKANLEKEKAKPAEIADRPETLAEIEKQKQAISEAQEEIASLEKKLRVASNTDMAKFSVIFKNVQEAINGAVEFVMTISDEEVKAKCKGALLNVLEVEL